MLYSGKINRTLRDKKKINILTLVLSEEKILNETKNHNPPLQVKWSVPKIHLKFKELWRNSLFDDNPSDCNTKLRTYRLFKDKFIQENYLKWGIFFQRRLITKFRISSHNLEIEHGRYFNISADH